MLHTRHAILALIPAFALGFLSCTVDPATENEENIAEEDEATLVIGDRESNMHGTYRAIATGPGGMTLLVLKTDGTYHRAITLMCPWAGPCGLAAKDDGQFSIRRRGGLSYMFLYSDSGRVNNYEYLLRGDTLRLRRLDQRTFISMTKTVEASWCDERQDCLLQNLRDPSCPGVWYCGLNLCNYACMAVPFEEPEPIKDPDPTEPLAPEL
jgi:hypothetical protein